MNEEGGLHVLQERDAVESMESRTRLDFERPEVIGMPRLLFGRDHPENGLRIDRSILWVISSSMRQGYGMRPCIFPPPKGHPRLCKLEICRTGLRLSCVLLIAPPLCMTL